MSRQKTFKLVALCAYLVIIIAGDMIGFPLCFYLCCYSLMGMGATDQFFAIPAVVGVVVNFVNLNKARTPKLILMDLFCLLLMLAPLVPIRMRVPFDALNYPAFTIPASVFLVFYLLSLFFAYKEVIHRQKA